MNPSENSRKEPLTEKISQVAILGAGAMGGFFADRFAGAPGFSTVPVALKHDCLADALPDLKHLVGPETPSSRY